MFDITEVVSFDVVLRFPLRFHHDFLQLIRWKGQSSQERGHGLKQRLHRVSNWFGVRLGTNLVGHSFVSGFLPDSEEAAGYSCSPSSSASAAFSFLMR